MAPGVCVEPVGSGTPSTDVGTGPGHSDFAAAGKAAAIAAESLNLLGKAAPGVSLLCLGLIMSSEKLQMSDEVWGNLGLKLFVHPVLMFAATVVLGTHGLYAQ